MKYLTLFLFLGFISCKKDGFIQAKHMPSKFDTLSPADIEHLVHIVDTNYRDFQIKSFTNYHDHYSKMEDSIIRQAAIKFKMDKGIYKADFDNNGYTDILALGDMHWCDTTSFCHPFSMVLMNFGEAGSKICELQNEIFYPLPVVPQLVLQKEGVPLIMLHNFNRQLIDKPTLLTYKYGGFVELTKKETFHNIEKVQFAVGPCFGSCPIFQIGIEKNGSATFLAEHYNFNNTFNGGSDEGFYTTALHKKELDNIICLLDYINFESLKNDYGVTWTDDRDAKLIITYDGGKTKTIRDYGLQGTYGLRLLYKQLHELRFNQNWKKAPEPKGVRIKPY